MSWMRRIAVITVILCTGAPLTGCAPRGSSFETLGVPAPEDRSGQSPIIFGWAREQRSGWVIRRIRIDGRARNEWNEETQTPAVLYLSPGEHEVQLSAAQLSDPNDMNSRPRRRYRVRPFQLDLLEGEAQLCVIRLEGEERPRPRAQCETYDQVDEVDVDDEMDEDEIDEYDDDLDEDEDVIDEVPTRDQQVQQQGTFGATPPTPGAAPPNGQESGRPGVPSPFGSAAANAPTPPPIAPTPPVDEPATPAAPVTPPPAPAAPPAASSSPPRRLSVEERLERLERLMEEIRRELHQR